MYIFVQYRLMVITICTHTHTEAVVVDKEKPPLNVVGDVHGRIAIIVVSCVQATSVCMYMCRLLSVLY